MLNLSSALLNLTQLINAAGYLGGWNRLSRHVAKVVNGRGKFNYKDLRILQETGVLNDIGLDTATGYDKNRGYSGSSIPVLGQAITMIDKLGNKSMCLFQTMDTICRISSTLAAYEQAIEKGKSRDEAIEFAKKLNRNSNFSYGAEDAPNAFRRTSIIGKFALQFMKYPFKQLEVIADFLPMSKKTNRAQKAAFWFPYLLTCGLMGLPALDWLDDLFGEKFSLFPKDFIQKVAIKGSIEIFGDNEIGRTAGKVAMYGLPAVLNIDISKRAGLATIIPQDLFGASISTVFGFGANMFNGEYANALRSVSPGLYNIYAAIEGETTGKRGRINDVYNSFYDRALRLSGFKSVDESLASDIQRITANDKKQLTKEKQKTVDDFIENPTGENARRLKELGIKPETVKEERERKKLDRLNRTRESMSKQERERNKYLFDFAK